MVRRSEDPITLQRLRFLVALADTGSVTAAAKASGVTQPALSQNLRIIERHYGFPLVIRAGRRLVLTRPARGVVEYARRILRLAEESERAARDVLLLRAGRLAVAASFTPGTYLVPQLMADFRARHPEVALALSLGAGREVERRVMTGEADLGVVSQTDGEWEASVRPFRRVEHVLVAPLAHPLAAAPRLDADALAAHPLIVRERGAGSREALERALAAAGLGLTVLFELQSTEAMLRAAAAGLGAGVVPEPAVTEVPIARRIRVRRVAGVELASYLAVVSHPDAEPGPAAREFIRLLERRGVPPAPEAA